MVVESMLTLGVVQIDLGDNTARIHRKKAKLRARGNLRGESRTAQLRRRQSRPILGPKILTIQLTSDGLLRICFTPSDST